MGPGELLIPTWTKRGVLLRPPFSPRWARSHAALPCLDQIKGDRFWLYFSTRDGENRSHIARVEVSVDAGRLEVGSEPPELVLAPGAVGAFDEDGVTISCVVARDEHRWLYYSGWTRGVSVPFYFYVGLAVSDDGGRTFRRASPAPILERNAADPFLTASPSVLFDDGTWRMWYVSATRWEDVAGGPRHRYHIRYAESDDGVTWRRDGTVCVDFLDDGEYAFGRPCVVRDGSTYRMWFCHRGDAYRLGYAESLDGVVWERDDSRVALDVGPERWDSAMLAYPWYVEHAGFAYLLYNGNGYGESGTGYAVATL